MAESVSIIDMACEILRATKDGDDLSPEHLYLLQEAVNGNINELGEVEFYKLYRSAAEGYRKPWFHDIEHLTIDHVGYVYWRGRHVEHYTLRWAFSEEAAAAAQQLASRCQRLERFGFRTTSITAVWCWETYEAAMMFVGGQLKGVM